MAESGFGFLIKFLREQRGLSLRELGRLAEVDHAYVHRLETGDKESPSAEVLGRLIKPLKAGKREAEMLHYLRNRPETPTGLVSRVVQDPTIGFDVFSVAASMVFRGRRPDFEEILQRARRALQDEDGNG